MFILDSLLIGSLRFVLDKVVAGRRSRNAGRLGAARSAARSPDAPRARRDHRRRVRRDRARRHRGDPRDQGPAAGRDLDVAPGQVRSPASTSRSCRVRLERDTRPWPIPQFHLSTAARAASARRRARRRAPWRQPAAARVCSSSRPIRRIRSATRSACACPARRDTSRPARVPGPRPWVRRSRTAARRRGARRAARVRPLAEGAPAAARRDSRARHLARSRGRRRAARSVDSGRRRARRPAGDRALAP